MKNAFTILAVGGLLLGAIVGVACSNAGDQGSGSARSVSNPLIANAAAAERDDGKERKSEKSADSSPFVVGVWKFVKKHDKDDKGDHDKDANDKAALEIDTEFRFINPTTETLTLEYAFFELDGTFCGCDRDDFPPNKTTEYTIFDETQLTPPLPNGPPVFSCTGKSGALKSIVFKNKGQRIFLDDAAQVGFQTHAFGGVVEGDNAAFIRGHVMTEAPLQGIALTDSTRDEIRAIHEQCNTVNGPL